MRVFVTGATGFIGTATVHELMNAGHKVLGLARSDERAEQLAAMGAEVHRGSLEDPESLGRGAAIADGVIHAAFIHDFSKFKENCETDRRAIQAMGAVLAGSGRPLVITSGTGFGVPPQGGIATEDVIPVASSASHPRIASEEAADAVAARGVHVSVMRFPPSVHGLGDHGFMHRLINIAREKGVSAYIDDGQNRWPAVHRLDAARAFRLALEKGATGARYHAIGDEGIATREIAGVIGRHLGLPVVSVSPADAAAHFGFMANFFAANVPASGKLTQQRLGWHFDQPGLIADLEMGHYFQSS